MHKHKFR